MIHWSAFYGIPAGIGHLLEQLLVKFDESEDVVAGGRDETTDEEGEKDDNRQVFDDSLGNALLKKTFNGLAAISVISRLREDLIPAQGNAIGRIVELADKFKFHRVGDKKTDHTGKIMVKATADRLVRRIIHHQHAIQAGLDIFEDLLDELVFIDKISVDGTGADTGPGGYHCRWRTMEAIVGDQIHGGLENGCAFVDVLVLHR
jgi:hypothetical protein